MDRAFLLAHLDEAERILKYVEDNAQSNLGVMYENGRGVPQDDVEAVKWYRLAADQGYAIAQYNLGSMYRTGEGVPQDDAPVPSPP